MRVKRGYIRWYRARRGWLVVYHRHDLRHLVSAVPFIMTHARELRDFAGVFGSVIRG